MNRLGAMSYNYMGWSVQAMAEEINNLGMRHIQFDPRQKVQVMDEDPFSLERADKIRTIFDHYNIKIVAISAYTNLVGPKKREEKLQQFKQMIDLCAEYGTQYICTETGSFHSTNGWRDCEENHTEAAFQKLLNIVDQLRHHAIKAGTTLLLEGFVNNVFRKPEQATTMIEQLGTDGLAFVLDPFNFITEEQLNATSQERVMQTIFDCLAAHSPIAHAKDTIYEDGNIKTPQVGAGKADWRTYASLLNKQLFDVPLILEHVTPEDTVQCVKFIEHAFSVNE